MSGDTAFLWAVPRSRSTVFEKAVSQQSGFQVLHEPFTYHYYFGPNKRSARYGEVNSERSDTTLSCPVAEAPRDEGRCLLVKELAFQGEPFVQDETLLAAKHVLLVRNPLATYRSLVKLKPDFTEEEFGFISLQRVIDRLDDLNIRPVAIFDGDRFAEDPDRQIRLLCRHMDVEFEPGKLEWESGKIRDWTSEEEQSQQKWHRTLENSGKVLPETESDTESFNINPSHIDIITDAIRIYLGFRKANCVCKKI
ncbi:sulfotransferase-like domain-containing protein [Devosia sp. CAU 1758]